MKKAPKATPESFQADPELDQIIERCAMLCIGCLHGFLDGEYELLESKQAELDSAIDPIREKLVEYLLPYRGVGLRQDQKIHEHRARVANYLFD